MREFYEVYCISLILVFFSRNAENINYVYGFTRRCPSPLMAEQGLAKNKQWGTQVLGPVGSEGPGGGYEAAQYS